MCTQPYHTVAFGEVRGLEVRGPTKSQFPHPFSWGYSFLRLHVQARFRCYSSLATDRQILILAQDDICKDGPKDLTQHQISDNELAKEGVLRKQCAAAISTFQGVRSSGCQG